MKKITAAMLTVGSMLYADYSIVYEMQDTEEPGKVMTSTFRYKDAEHGRVDMKMKGEPETSTMLVSGKKAYMITYDDGKANVMDMDEMMKMGAMYGGGMPEEAEAEAKERRDNVKWRKTGKRKTVGGIKGEIWEVTDVEDGKKKTYEIVMTNDSDYVKAVHAYEGVMKRMVEGGGGAETEMFTMIEKGYAPIEIEGGQMRLRSFNEENVDKGVFELPKGAEVQKSPFGSMFAFGGGQGDSGKKGGIVDKCYNELCCGQTKGEAEVLSKMVRPSAMGYKLGGSAKCDPLGLGSLFGVDSVEGAIYKSGEEVVTVEMDLDAKDEGTVMLTRESEAQGGGIKASGYKTGFIGEYKYHYAVLQPMNVQHLDVVMGSGKLVKLSHPAEKSKVPLVKFAKEAIDFDAYAPAAAKPKQQKEQKASDAAAQEDDGSDSFNKEAINKGVDDAVEMFKSLF